MSPAGTRTARSSASATPKRRWSNASPKIRTILGTLDDIVSPTIYFLNRADLPGIQRVRARHFKIETARQHPHPGRRPRDPEFLVELVPIAVVPHARFRRPAQPRRS
jgi:hypothetical protein